ncbi:MAG: AEC family transporter [Clostridia bacterium]|nr:AEC family transporter [Clostridia bacterium]
MDYFPSLLTIILTLFLLMVCGYICRKTKIIDNSSSKGLSRLIISVGQPMMIISALANAEYSKENLTVAWQVTLISFVMHILMSLAAYLICMRMKKQDTTKIFEFTLIFSNCGFIGFPIMDAILGDGRGSFMGAFYVIAFHLFLWTWGIMILARRREDIRMTPKKAILNYGTVPCVIGVVLYLCKPLFELPECFGKFFSYLGGLCTPISVLITGALLATISLPKMFTNGKLYLHSLIKLILFPVAVCLLAKLCGLQQSYILLATAMAGMPSAATVTMLAELYEIEPGYASQTVGITSLLSTASLPLVMLFAQWISAL